MMKLRIMKPNTIFRKKSSLLLFSISVFFTLLLASCADNNNESAPYFYIENQPTGMAVDAVGIAQSAYKSYTIRSNRPWTITKESDTSWLHVFADEGEDDGIFDIWVDQNALFTSRTGNLIFRVDGQEQPVMFRVDQKANVVTVSIVNAANGVDVPTLGGTVKVPVKANVAWTASLSDNDWAKIDSVNTDTVYLKVNKNTDDVARTCTLTATGSGEYSTYISSTKLTQAAMGLIMNEHFDWMQEGIVDSLYNYPEVNFASWNTGELSHGWTSSGVSMYGGRGYLKVGKTNYGGDLISPKLSGIDGTQDVSVSFKSIGYISAGSTTSAGAKDDGIVNVVILGGGTISGVSNTTQFTIQGVTYTAGTFSLSIYPNSKNQENGAAYNPWGQAGAAFSFKIKNATSETQIMFIGGTALGSSLKGQGQGKNRCYFDDIKVVVSDE
jgi:hypothetical protein